MSLPQFIDTVLRTVTLFVHPPQADGGLTDAQFLAAIDAVAQPEETIEVSGDAPAESASSVHLGSEQLRYRSRTQPSDVLRQIPGLVVSQHAGGGKSDQYFIRGFDADHGTDVAIFADGVPVNLVSHGHGQGYADTHWMIPETIASVDMHKGPYAARYGDFATAGALELATIDSIASHGAVWVAGGSPLGHAADHVDRRLVGMASPRLRGGDKTLIALQVGEADGPFDHPQDFRNGAALGKWTGALGFGELQLQTTWYAGRWNQSGQLPEGEIAAGRLSRFGSLDPTEGGDAMRASVHARYATEHLRVLGYGVRNQLDLFSNFTLFADDPIHGDQIEQTDDRWLYGAHATYERSVGRRALLTAGAQLRADAVTTSLWHTAKRMRLGEPTDHTANAIHDLAAYAEGKVFVTDWLHILPGMRVDRLGWRVRDIGTPEMPAAGSAAATVASPKLSVELVPESFLSFFVNAGAGFHSNDARAAVANGGNGAFARALGTEGGFRMRPHPRAHVSADAWYPSAVSVASSLPGRSPMPRARTATKPRRSSCTVTPPEPIQRGASASAPPLPALATNVACAHVRFASTDSHGVASSEPSMSSPKRRVGSDGSVPPASPLHTSSDDRYRYLVVDVIAGRRFGDLDLGLTINNALDADWREAQFAESSRVTPAAAIVEQMHYTPGVPFTVTVTAAMSF